MKGRCTGVSARVPPAIMPRDGSAGLRVSDLVLVLYTRPHQISGEDACRDRASPMQLQDLVYALDMFRMIDDPGALLGDIRRIARPEGTLIIDDGYRSREKKRWAIRKSRFRTIEEEIDEYLQCRPLQAHVTPMR